MGVRKAVKGFHTKPNVWDEARRLELRRGGEKLDPGVNYFVLMLDQLGLPTHFSCEGHPGGFYITFEGPYEAAVDIHAAGFFSVEVEREEYWSIRRHTPVEDDGHRVDALRWAAEAWEKKLGPLNFDDIVLER